MEEHFWATYISIGDPNSMNPMTPIPVISELVAWSETWYHYLQRGAGLPNDQESNEQKKQTLPTLYTEVLLLDAYVSKSEFQQRRLQFVMTK